MGRGTEVIGEPRDPATLSDAELNLAIEREVFGHTAAGQHGTGPFTPAYATDPEAAMSVFEAAVAMTGSGAINADMEDARGEGFVVVVWFGPDDIGAFGRFPRAICEAALRAVRGA